ncbi:hypothetical protein CR513_07147, partial [Mucuna pruriens]
MAYTNPPLAPHIPPYQSRTDNGTASTGRHKKTAKDAGPNSHAIHKAAPPFKLVNIIPLKPLEPPYPRSYDPNVRCDYHDGAIGHATERCWSLKHKVQDLLDGSLLGFQDQGLNVQNNPLLAHRGVVINAISHENRGEVEGADESYFKHLTRTYDGLNRDEVVPVRLTPSWPGQASWPNNPMRSGPKAYPSQPQIRGHLSSSSTATSFLEKLAAQVTQGALEFIFSRFHYFHSLALIFYAHDGARCYHWRFSRLRKCRLGTEKSKVARGDRLDYQHTLVDLILSVLASGGEPSSSTMAIVVEDGITESRPCSRPCRIRLCRVHIGLVFAESESALYTQEFQFYFENAARCTTNSASRMEEGTHLSRLSKVKSALVAYIEGNGNHYLKLLIIHYNLAS